MGGKGKRYNEVSFHGPKPLLEIDGKPMIEHVVNLFSPQDEFLFICNEEHLQTTNLRQILGNLTPKFKIIPVNYDQIEGGPVYTCFFAFDDIKDDEGVIVNYCDFTMKWDYRDFLHKVQSIPCDGAIPSFKGFHPASLGNTYYAYMEVSGAGYVTGLREKESFSEDRKQDYASTGTYYFKTGLLFKHYCQRIIEQKISVRGEAYATLPYILMMQEGRKVLNYEVEKFICWGTPRDYEIYKFWSEFFFSCSGSIVGFNNVNIKTTNIFPLAGGEKSFGSLGIEKPNYLIPLLNKPLLFSTVNSHPRGIKNIFLCLEDHKTQYNIDPMIKSIFQNTEIIYLPEKTGGNAETILKCRDSINQDSPVCVSGNNYILRYDERRLSHLFDDISVDVIVFTLTHHEYILRNPKYGYVKLHDGKAEFISEKEVISENPYKDHAVVGTVIYRKANDLFDSIQQLISLDPHKQSYFTTAINRLIQEGKKVVPFEVDKFVSLNSTTDYQEFIYWQDYFDKLPYHPYSKMVH